MKPVLIDTGPLVALIDAGDADHARCAAAAKALRGDLVTTWPAVTEAMYLLAGAPAGQDALLEQVEAGSLAVAELSSQDVPAIRSLMKKYQDLPMDFADASLVTVAGRDSIHEVFTLDRHFRTYRLPRGRTFVVIPAR